LKPIGDIEELSGIHIFLIVIDFFVVSRDLFGGAERKKGASERWWRLMSDAAEDGIPVDVHCFAG
jgi:hypothetical protein